MTYCPVYAILSTTKRTQTHDSTKEARTMKEEAIKRLLNDETAMNQYYFDLSKNIIDCIKIVKNDQQHNN